MENKTLELLMQYGRVLQQWLYPRLEEELGPLTEKHQQVVRVLGLARIEAAVGASGGGVGGRSWRKRFTTWRRRVRSWIC